MKGGKVTQYPQLQNATSTHRRSRCLRLRFCRADQPTDCGAGDHAHRQGRLLPRCRQRRLPRSSRASSARAKRASSAAPTGKRCTASTTRRRAPRTGVRRGPLRRHSSSCTAAPRPMTDAGLKMRIQFYTSRGFAVLDVNYSGSTGYGRAYRQRLDGAWGIADVADCAAGARHLAKAGSPTGPHRHLRRQRRRLHHADGARHDPGVRRRQQPLRHIGLWGCCSSTRTSSSRAICTA